MCASCPCRRRHGFVILGIRTVGHLKIDIGETKGDPGRRACSRQSAEGRTRNEATVEFVHAPMVIEERTTLADERTRPSSFEDLFLAERIRLYRALCVLTGDRSEAEDLAQDAFVRVLVAWDRVGTLDDPVGYLYRTALNGARSRYRRSVLAVRRQLRPPEGRDELDLVEERAEIVRSLANLTYKQRASVILLDILEMTSSQAAAALGMSAGAVRTQASRDGLKYDDGKVQTMDDVRTELRRASGAFGEPGFSLRDIQELQGRRDRARRMRAAGVAAVVDPATGAFVATALVGGPRQGSGTGSYGTAASPTWPGCTGKPEGVHLGTSRPDGSGAGVLTDGVPELITGGWSPDGSQIVFSHDPVETPDGDVGIWTMAADGTDLTQLTDGTSLDLEPQWSPDGSKILFLRHPEAVSDEPSLRGTTCRRSS